MGKQHILFFRGKVTTIPKDGSIEIANVSDVKFYLDGEEAYKESSIVNAAWWVKLVKSDTQATMHVQLRNITHVYNWRQSFLGKERSEDFNISIPVMHVKPEYFGQPGVLSRVALPGEVFLGAKAKGKGKAKLTKGRGDDEGTATSAKGKGRSGKQRIPKHLK